MKKYSILIGVAMAIVLGIMATANVLAFANIAPTQYPTPNNIQIPPPVITSTGGITGFICTLVVWIFWGLIVLAVVMFLIGGYHYVTSGGDSEKVSKANKTLLYAAIAVVVALVAAGLPYIISSFFWSFLPPGSVCGIF